MQRDATVMREVGAQLADEATIAAMVAEVVAERLPAGDPSRELLAQLLGSAQRLAWASSRLQNAAIASRGAAMAAGAGR